MTEDEYAARQRRQAMPCTQPLKQLIKQQQSASQKRTQALGRLKTGRLNQTEAAYAAILETRKIAGEVSWYRFEGLKFRLADNTFYTPDFAVMLADGMLEMHEVKGHWTDDARVKIRVAADAYPMRFIAVSKSKTGWSTEVF